MIKSLKYLRKEEKMFQEFLECYDEDQKEDEEYLSVLNALLEAQEAISELEEQEAKSCDLCRSKFCSAKRILIENDEINTSYFYCNDYEPKA